jgi:phospholipase C
VAMDRRSFLQSLGGTTLATAFPASIARALSMRAPDQTCSIASVEHIVILMQENRAFDHYFGTLNGVRGFADPRAVTLPSGNPVFYQPNGTGGYTLPFHPAATTGTRRMAPGTMENTISGCGTRAP